MPEFSHVGNDVLYILASNVGNIHFPNKNSKVDSNVTTLEAFRTGQFMAIDNGNIVGFLNFYSSEYQDNKYFLYQNEFSQNIMNIS